MATAGDLGKTKSFIINSNNKNNSPQKSASNPHLSHESTHICSVCAEVDPKFWSVASGCGHKICWMCSLRLRALYGSKSCPICKTESEFVYICKRAEDATPKLKSKIGGVNFNDSLSVSYENEVTRTTCEALLLLKCPFNHALSGGGGKGAACEKAFKVKNDLRRHVQSAHDLEICEICLEHKKCFSVELPLYNRSSLQKHQREANHPRCQVCDRIFYSEDELNEHCRDAHELCHICQRNGRPNRHFLNYARLEEHFKKEHFLCPEPLCRELKFVVFGSELEYKAHQAEVHLSHQKLQRSQQRQLQRLNITFGEASNNSNSNNSNNNNNNNSNNNNNNNSAPLKLTSDQRNQIAANLVFGEVTDDLANRLQSLSLYQNRNDQFVETLRGAYQLSQAQIHSIFTASREFQRGNSSATQLVTKIEAILTGIAAEDVYKICGALSDLQLDPEKQQRCHVALSQYKEKCLAFPELSAAVSTSTASSSKSALSGKKVWVSGSFAKGFKEDEKSSDDPFGFARQSKNNNDSSGYNSKAASAADFSQRQVKVLQIVKPSTASPQSGGKSADPSKNPALLLSQLAGGPSYRKKSTLSTISTGASKSKPAKVSSFSAAALGGGNNSLNFAVGSGKSKTAALDEQEFPSLSAKNSGSTISNPTITSFVNPLAATTNNNNAFFAPNDRDQLESFTIGDEESSQQSHQEIEDFGADGKKGAKKGSKKVVFRYGQKWDL